MNKTVIFPFRDGLKRVSLGQTVMLHDTNSGKLQEVKVTRIGIKYLTITCYSNEYKFDFERGVLSTGYCNLSLWFSLKEYKQVKNDEVMSTRFRKELGNKTFSTDRLIKCAKILGISLSEKD